MQLLPRTLLTLGRSTLAAALVAGATTSALTTTAAGLVLAAAPAPGAGVHHAYVVKVTNRGAYPDPDATILAMIDTALDRWEVESNGRISSFDRVGGITEMEATSDCTQGGPMRTQAATLFPDVDFSGEDGNLLIVVAPNECHGGEATVGWDINSSGKMSFDYDPRKSPNTLMHEIGHTFSLAHAHAIVCDPDCADNAYGNRYDFMGISVLHDPAYVPPALDSYQRIWLDIADECEIPAVRLPRGQRTSTATYQLLPRGTDAGTRGLEVTDPVSGDRYFLDYRNAAGRDAQSYYPTSTAASGAGWFRPGITVEKGVVDNDGYDVDSVLQTFSQPDGSTVHSKLAGESFQVGGLTVRVDDLGAVGDPAAIATVTVTLTDPQGTEDLVADPSADRCAAEAAVDPPAEVTPPVTPTASPTASPTPSPTPTPSAPLVQPDPSGSPSASEPGPPYEPVVTPVLSTVTPPALPAPVLSTPPLPTPTLPMPAPPIVTVPAVPGPSLTLPSLTGPLPSLTVPAVPTAPATTAAAHPGPAEQPTNLPTGLPTAPATGAPTNAPLPGPASPSVHGSPETPTVEPTHEPGDDTVPRPGGHPGAHPDLPETGAPQLVLAEIAAAAFALAFGGFLLVAARRQRPSSGFRPMKPSSLV